MSTAERSTSLSIDDKGQPTVSYDGVLAKPHRGVHSDILDDKQRID